VNRPAGGEGKKRRKEAGAFRSLCAKGNSVRCESEAKKKEKRRKRRKEKKRSNP